MSLKEILQNDWQKEVLDCDIPVIVKISAEWCMPCKLLAPILEDFAVEYEGKAKFVQIDADKSRDLLIELQIMAVPTILIFAIGKQIEKLVGVRTKKDIKVQIEKVINEYKNSEAVL